MTRSEADDLSQLITRTWRGGPAADIWVDVLGEFNHNQAQAAYRRLRDEADKTPSIAQFLAVYRSLARRDTPDAANGCHYCDGHGWISTTLTAHGREYSASAACTNCAAGKTTAHHAVEWCNKRTEAT